MSIRTTRSKAKRNGRADAENGHVRISDEIVYRRLSEIRPSPENDKLYKPIDTSNPDFRAFVEKVRVNRITDALIVTIDGYICSGHRRYAAARIAGIDPVPCRTASIRHDDPRFLTFLRDCNRQRVKSLDEVLREEVVSMNPEAAHRALLEHRKAQSRVDVQEIVIEGEKRRAKISKAKQPFLDAIEIVLQRLRDFWPLSVRQIHYNLLNAPPLIHASKPGSKYRNTLKCYKSLDELLVRARFDGYIPFEAIQDKTRSVVTWKVHQAAATFIREELNDLFMNYHRDLQQSQPNHIEIIGEKNTIEGIIRPVAMEHMIPYTLGRGYTSLPPRKAMAQRFQRSGKDRLIILNLSDFDPEGEDIPHSYARSMRDDLGIKNVVAVKVGLTLDQVTELELPPQMKAKEGSSRYAGFVGRYGDDVYELEAVPPEWLQQELRDAIDSVLDIDAYNREIDAEADDSARLDLIREKVKALLMEGDLLGENSDMSEFGDDEDDDDDET